MDYRKIYQMLVSEKDNRRKDDGIYYESHHIIARCNGGKDSDENLVLLTAREHFIAHHLLTKIYPNDRKLKHALNMMHLNGGDLQRNITSRVYAICKKANSDAAKLRVGELNPFFGKKHSDETRKRLKESRAKLNLLGDENPNFGNRWTWEERGYDKSKLQNRKRPDLSKLETRKKLREAKLGAGNPRAEKWAFRNKITNEVTSFCGGMKRWCIEQGTSITRIRKGNHPIWELSN